MDGRSVDTIKNKTTWLEAHCKSGIVTATCQETGIARSTVYKWTSEDPDFAAAKKAAEEAAIEMLEAEARRRAFLGVEKPVYQGGKEVGKVREYSDSLMMFILKAKKPEYRDRVQQDITLNGAVSLTELVDDEPGAD